MFFKLNMKFYIFFVVLNVLSVVQSAKILGIFHFPSKSHHILGSALLKELAKRGHEVTMVSPYPLKTPLKNYRDIALPLHEDNKDEIVNKIANKSPLQNILHVKTLFLTMTENALKSEALTNLLKSNEKFDLIIQFWLFGEPLLGIAHQLKAPVIGFSPIGSSPMLDMVTGNISPYSFVPNIMLTFSSEMNFFQRVANTVISTILKIFFTFAIVPEQEELLQKYFPEAPPLQELLDGINLFLINTHYSTEGVKPYLSNLIHIGGFHLQEKETLPEDLKKYLDEAKEGVVYMSLGSNMKSSSLDPKKIESFKNVFSKLKLKVLWKFEKDLPGKSTNVRIENWLPQRAVLNHPNVKIFITHAGYGGVTEATYFGKPMLCIPFFGDQTANAAEIVRKGYGILLPFDDVNEKNLEENLLEIINNDKYLKNVQKTSSLLRSQPINPMDKAVFWVEHVIKFKNTDHFKTVAKKLPFYKYFLLDVIAFILFCIVMSLVIVKYSFKLITKGIKTIFTRGNKTKKSQ